MARSRARAACCMACCARFALAFARFCGVCACSWVLVLGSPVLRLEAFRYSDCRYIPTKKKQKQAPRASGTQNKKQPLLQRDPSVGTCGRDRPTGKHSQVVAVVRCSSRVRCSRRVARSTEHGTIFPWPFSCQSVLRRRSRSRVATRVCGHHLLFYLSFSSFPFPLPLLSFSSPLL